MSTPELRPITVEALTAHFRSEIARTGMTESRSWSPALYLSDTKGTRLGIDSHPVFILPGPQLVTILEVGEAEWLGRRALGELAGILLQGELLGWLYKSLEAGNSAGTAPYPAYYSLYDLIGDNPAFPPELAIQMWNPVTRTADEALGWFDEDGDVRLLAGKVCVDVVTHLRRHICGLLGVRSW